MIISRWFIEKFSGHFEKSADLNFRTLQQSLSIALDAKQKEVDSIITVKDSQIEFLQSEINVLKTQIVHERARAEAAVDQILNMSRAAAISNADLAREATESEIKHRADENRPTEIKRIFDEVNAGMEE